MGLIQRHITEDFINHVFYGDYLLDDNATFKGETMDETLVSLYVREMSRYYESENIPYPTKERALHGDIFVMRMNLKISARSESEKHYLALGIKKLAFVAADYGIKIKERELNELREFEIDGEGNLHDIISDYYKRIDPDCEELPENITLPEWKDIDNEVKRLFKYPDKFNEFVRGCYLPNGELKKLDAIAKLYDKKRVQIDETIGRNIPTRLYNFLVKYQIIRTHKEGKTLAKGYSLRTFQREMRKLEK